MLVDGFSFTMIRVPVYGAILQTQNQEKQLLNLQCQSCHGNKVETFAYPTHEYYTTVLTNAATLFRKSML